MKAKKTKDTTNRNCTTCAFYILDTHLRGVCTLYPDAGHVDAKTVCPQWQQVEK